jgi:hypothetical protein
MTAVVWFDRREDCFPYKEVLTTGQPSLLLVPASGGEQGVASPYCKVSFVKTCKFL